MHKDSKDICFKIQGMKLNDDGSRRFIGHWINLGYTGNPWQCVDRTNVITIEKENLKDWKQLSQETLTTPRTQPGRP
jgi:hypothetical protein